MKSNSVDLTMPLNMPPAVPEPAVSSDWEAWRDENTIEVCEISVSTAGSALCRFLPSMLRYAIIN